MATGTQRRTVVQDSLQGAAEVVPVQSTAPSLSIPQAPVADVVNNVNTRIAASLGQWQSKSLKDIANAKNMADELDGRMKFQYGQTLEDTEMEGNKWAVNGYRVIQAETLSSSMLASQQELIRQSGYQLSPEEFRGQYVSQLEQQVSGLDPTTANFVSDSMSKQMPTLVAQHQSAYLADQEKQAYQSLVSSVDVMSKDDTVTAEFLSNSMGGVGSASEFLSDARRTAAMVEGTASAFAQGNPLAYAKLKAAGALASLSPAQRGVLATAEAGYKSKIRSTLDQGYISAIATFNRKVASGDFHPDELLEERVALDEKYGRDTNAAEGGNTYVAAAQAEDLRKHGDVVRIATAASLGDWDTIADLTQKHLIEAESGGDPNAVGPVITAGSNYGTRAQGKFQVMPLTVKDPGFGIRPADVSNPKDVARVGKEYWRTMIGGSASSGVLKWAPGDIEAAAIAYNAGPGNANKWIGAGRDYSVLPQRSQTEPYAKGILAASSGEGVQQGAAAATKAAQDQHARVKKAMNAELLAAFNLNLRDLSEQYRNGDITEEEYLAGTTSTRRAMGIEMSAAISTHVSSTVAEVHKQAAKRLTAEQKVLMDADAAILEDQFNAAVTQPDLSDADRDTLRDQYFQAVVAGYAAVDISLADFGFDDTVTSGLAMVRRGNEAHAKRQEENTLIDRASSNGTMPDLPVDLQRRGWKTITDNVNQYFADAAQAGRLPPEDVEIQVKQALLSQYVSAGGVDPVEKDRSTAVMRGALVNAAGDINENVAEVVNTYATLKATSPHVADSLLSPEGRVMAEAIIDAAGGPGMDVRDGMTLIAASAFTHGGVRSNKAEDRDEAYALVQESSSDFLSSQHVGLWEYLTTSISFADANSVTASEREVIDSTASSDLITNAITAEVARRSTLSPTTQPKHLVKAAATAVANRTDMVGSSLIIMSQGFGMKDQMFGSRAGTIDEPRVVNSVILDHLRDKATEPGFEFISDVSVSDVLFDAEVGVSDVASLALVRGVRPFVTISDGRNVSIQIQKSDGSLSQPIPIDLPAVGTAYFNKYKDRLINQ